METSSIHTLFTGKFLIKLREIDSTNNYLRNWVSNNAPIEGAVILAENQTQGRGQMGTSWQSAPNMNITMSLLYIPKFLLAKDQFILSTMVAVSIYETIVHFLGNQKVEIKWPNDIMVNKKKICGILIENSIQGFYLQNSIIGIGLNVLQSDFGQLEQATSLYLHGYSGDKDTVTRSLLEHLEKNYLLLKSGKCPFILENYHRVLLGKGEKLKFSDHLSEFNGIIQGVKNNGRLIVETEQGNRYFDHKEIVFL